MERYSRLERYVPLGATLPRWRRSSCAVVGCGGLGGGLVDQLARFGVARLVLIDRDAVAPENLGHQRLFTAEDAERAVPKAVAAAEYARLVNPQVAVESQVAELTRRNIDALLDSVELVFDGLDNYFGRLLLNDFSRARSVPYFYAGVVRGELSVRAVIPGNPGCLRCLLDRPPAAGEASTCAAEGVFPPLLGLANALQLDAANRWLAGQRDATAYPMYSLALPDWTLRQLELPPRADCPACAGRYEYLDGTLDLLAQSACSEGRAELELPQRADLTALARTLELAGFAVRLHGGAAANGAPALLTARQNGRRYTLLPGKVVLEGGAAEDLSRFAATYLGL